MKLLEEEVEHKHDLESGHNIGAVGMGWLAGGSDRLWRKGTNNISLMYLVHIWNFNLQLDTSLIQLCVLVNISTITWWKIQRQKHSFSGMSKRDIDILQRKKQKKPFSTGEIMQRPSEPVQEWRMERTTFKKLFYPFLHPPPPSEVPLTLNRTLKTQTRVKKILFNTTIKKQKVPNPITLLFSLSRS